MPIRLSLREGVCQGAVAGQAATSALPFILGGVLLASGPAWADSGSPLNAQLAVGLNSILPYGEVKLGYRVSQDPRSEIFLGLSPYGLSLNEQQYLWSLEIGFKRGFASLGSATPYWTAALGGGASTGKNGTFPSFVAKAGVGIDWNILSAQVTFGLPGGIMPEVGLNFAF